MVTHRFQLRGLRRLAGNRSKRLAAPSKSDLPAQNLHPLMPMSSSDVLLQLQAERRGVDLVWFADTLLYVYKEDWLHRHVPDSQRGIDPLRFKAPSPERPQGPEITALTHILRHDSSAVLIDVGCNYGVQAVRMLRTAQYLGFPAKIYLFDPGIAGKLSVINLELNGFSDFDYYNYAISDRDGYVSVYIVEGESQDNKIINKSPSALQLPVYSLKLSSFLRSIDHHGLAFVKIDTQGAEYEVFRGLDDAFRRSRFAGVVEYFPNGLATRIAPRKFLASLCEEFVVYDLGPNRTYARRVTGDTVDETNQRVSLNVPPFTDLLVLSRGLPELRSLTGQIEEVFDQ